MSFDHDEMSALTVLCKVLKLMKSLSFVAGRTAADKGCQADDNSEDSETNQPVHVTSLSLLVMSTTCWTR